MVGIAPVLASSSQEHISSRTKNMEHLTLETYRGSGDFSFPDGKFREIYSNLRKGNRETVVLHGLGEEIGRVAGRKLGWLGFFFIVVDDRDC